MKKLLILLVFGTLLGAVAGCRIGECWNYAWNSRFPPRQQQAVVVGQPCIVTDSCCTPCSPCGSPCSAPCGGSCGAAPVITPNPVPVR
jgi:hypothetical protein